MNKLERMTPPLSLDFHLPTGEDYDDVIAGIDKDVREEGSASLFLGAMRYQRRSWKNFHDKTLVPFGEKALAMEEVDGRGITVDRQHKLANAALAGMLFGHIANEASYPLLNERYYPYEDIAININMLVDAETSFAEAGSSSTPRGRQIGYGAMAGHFLDQLHIHSFQTLDKWSHEVVYDSNKQRSFMYGFGVALYAAWDLYSDKLVAEGRANEIGLSHIWSQSDGGDD